MRPRFLLPTAAACGCLLAPAVQADAASRFIVRGAGFGHGVGMSQYGAYGYAMRGFNYQQILAHYYTGTALGIQPQTTVRVLLQASTGVARFSGGRTAGGRRLDPARTYGARRGAVPGTVELLSPTGRRLARVPAPLTVTNATGAAILGGTALNGVTSGAYRGTLQFSPSASGGVQSVNALSLDDYVRGVVSRESPSTWPAEALKAQAVAARSYAVTTTKGGAGWDQYPDTRSQVYGGVAAETPATDAAVAGTTGQVVTYQGRPVVTFFFSTSGGRTEDVENTVLGDTPLPWLRSVDDPYDGASPKHRWGPYRWTLSATARRLRGLVLGRFRGIEVIQRGESPRIVAADVVGSGGRVRVSGATLRSRLGLYDTWAYFTSITTGKALKPEPTPAPVPLGSTGGATPKGRAAALARRRVIARMLHAEGRAAALTPERLVGRVLPVRRGSALTVQRREAGRWRRVGSVATDARGRYTFAVQAPGRYRVRYRGNAGPAVAIR